MGYGGPEGCVKGGPRVEFDLSELAFPCGHKDCANKNFVDSEGKWCTECLLRESVTTAKAAKVGEVCDNLLCQKIALMGCKYCSAECEAEAHGDLNKYEYVNHPKHYNEHPSGIECIDVIEHMPFNIGTAMKYLWRVGLKPGQEADQDLKKAIWYIERQRVLLRERTRR